MITENSQPTAIMFTEAPSLSRLFRCMAYVMVYQRSPVIIINVNTDNMHENTVRNPATWQPIPVTPAIIVVNLSAFRVYLL